MDQDKQAAPVPGVEIGDFGPIVIQEAPPSYIGGYPSMSPTGIDPVGFNAKLRAALVKAQAVVKAASKDGQNQHARYSYSSREEIAQTAKEAMAEAKLAFDIRGPMSYGDIEELSVKTQSGTRSVKSRMITWLFLLTHESGEREEWEALWPMELRVGMSAEQNVGAALSYAHKNAVLALLNIPRDLPGQEVESHQRPNEPARKPAVKRNVTPKKSKKQLEAQAKDTKRRKALAADLKEESVLSKTKATAKKLGLAGSMLSQTTADLERLYKAVFATKPDRSEWTREKKIEAIDKDMPGLKQADATKIEALLLNDDGAIQMLDNVHDDVLDQVLEALDDTIPF